MKDLNSEKIRFFATQNDILAGILLITSVMGLLICKGRSLLVPCHLSENLHCFGTDFSCGTGSFIGKTKDQGRNEMKKLLFRGVIICFSAMVAACASPSIEKTGAIYRITVPSDDLVIEFPAQGFKVDKADTSAPYFYLTDGKANLNIAFEFQSADKCKSSETCRDYFARKMKASYPSKKNWRSAKIGQTFMSENMDGAMVGGFDPRLQHINAHYVQDDLWLNIHLMKMNYDEIDGATLANFIQAMRFMQKKD